MTDVWDLGDFGLGFKLESPNSQEQPAGRGMVPSQGRGRASTAMMAATAAATMKMTPRLSLWWAIMIVLMTSAMMATRMAMAVDMGPGLYGA